MLHSILDSSLVSPTTDSSRIDLATHQNQEHGSRWRAEACVSGPRVLHSSSPSPTHCLSPSPERKRIVTSTRTREQRAEPRATASSPASGPDPSRGRGDSARRGSARPARSIPSGLGLDPGDDLDPRLERFRPRPSTFRRSRIRPFCAATAPSSRRHVPPTISALPMVCDMPTMSDMRRLATRRRLVCHASVFIVLGIKRHLGALIGWIIACLG